MKLPLLITVVGLLSACGSAAQELVVPMQLQQGVVRADLLSITVDIVGSMSVSGDPIDCVSLQTEPPLGRDDIEVVYAGRGAFSEVTQMRTIPSATNAVVWVEAFDNLDALGTSVARGCVEGVTLRPGQRTQIGVLLAAP